MKQKKQKRRDRGAEGKGTSPYAEKRNRGNMMYGPGCGHTLNSERSKASK